nr:rho GTPase-activating protein 12-like isoform X2 [Halyomorpha halys]
MEINDTNVEVLYDFEYATKDGQTITIKEGEKLLLLKKTNSDWWQVIRSTGRRPFYVPSTYVRIVEGSKDKAVVDVANKKEKPKLQASPLTPPHNFTVSVNIKPGPGDVSKKKKSSSKTKVMLNCESDNEVLSTDKVSDRYGQLPTPDYSIVQMPKQKDDTTAEANILDDNLSSSLSEMAQQIKFEPVKIKGAERLRYSGSFKTEYEKKILLRSFSGSTPDLTGVDNQEKEERDVNRIKSVEELKSDQENNIVVKGIKPIINIKSLGDIAEKLEKNMAKFLNSNMSMSYVENNNLKDSTDSVESGRASGETGGASSSDSIELKPKIPVAKPRRSLRPKQEEVIYANCQELMRGESPANVPDLPSGWNTQVDTETHQTCYVHTITGDKWHSASDALGRVYYFRENSSESSWTLPTHQAPSPEPPPQAEEMAAIFSKISNIEFGPRRMRNAKAFSMMIPNKKEENEMTSSLKGWPQLSDGRMKELRGDVVVQRVICEGPLHYTKICEGGKRVRKNWTSVYVVLNDLFLLIYKDIKAYHSSRGHPEVTLDLNGAEVSSGEKVSGRKHVLLFSTQQELGHKVALQCENINSALHWATTIQHTINTLPKATESVRNAKLGMITEGTSPEDLSKKGANIGRSKSVNFKNKDDSMEDLGVSSAERQVKIKARLKKFFHKRPTMESLVKKGIWKGIFLPRAKLDKRMLILHEPVFGCYLEAACSSADSSNPKVPKFVQRCISIIERLPENMKTDGLYRASGNLSQIQKIRLQIDQNHYEILEKEEDVHVLTGALKLFFRELKEPLIPCKLFTKAIKASTTPNRKERISMFQDIVKALPPINRETLKFLLQHLLRVTQYQEHNRMHVANVAIVFGPTLMWPEQESTNMALDLMQQNMVIEALLIDYQTIFK